MTTKITKPSETLLHHIEINSAVQTTATSFQEKFYQPQDYFIEKDQHTGEYYLRNKNLFSSLTKEVPEYTVHAFVILEKENHLILEIGDCNHHIIAKRAPSVVAAGDIYAFSKNKKIFKITDQAGSYHIQADDPLAVEKKESVKTAMKALGLPVHLFVPFKFKPFMFQHTAERNTTAVTKVFCHERRKSFLET